MKKELSDIFGKPGAEKNGIWDTGFTIRDCSESAKSIIGRDGNETEYLIVGNANPKIIDKEGKTIAYIDGHLQKRICDILYNDTGYFISGKVPARICYYPKKREL